MTSTLVQVAERNPGQIIAKPGRFSRASLQPDPVIVAESTLLRELIPHGSKVVDFGCGMGRHLLGLNDHITLGVGVDYETAYIAEAVKLVNAPQLHFFVGDATAVPLTGPFDVAVCLTGALVRPVTGPREPGSDRESCTRV